MSEQATTMRVERTTEGDLLFSGRLAADDLARLRLDHFDRALLDDCGSEGRSAADWLLGLEMLFRRIAEQRAAASVGTQRRGEE